MTISADTDQLASSEEANWSGSTWFAKAGHIGIQQDQGKYFNTIPVYLSLLLNFDLRTQSKF